MRACVMSPGVLSDSAVDDVFFRSLAVDPVHDDQTAAMAVTGMVGCSSPVPETSAFIYLSIYLFIYFLKSLQAYLRLFRHRRHHNEGCDCCQYQNTVTN